MKLLKNTLIYFSADIFNKAVPFLLLPILTTYLTPKDYGIIATYGVLINILVIFIGLNTIGSIEINFFQISKNKIKEYIGNVLYIFSITTTSFLIVYFIFGDLASLVFDIPKVWLLIAIFIALAQVLTTINLILWRVEHKAKEYSSFEIVQNLFNITLTLIFVISLEMNWEGRLLAIAIGIILFGGLSLLILVKVRKYTLFTYNKEYIKDALNYGIPLIPHSLAGWIKTGLDRIFITSIIGISATGIYSVGYQLGTIIAIVATSLSKAWLPKLYEMLSNDMGNNEKKQIVKVTYLYFIGISILLIILYFSLGFFVDYFIDEKFSSSKVIIFYILIAYAFNAMYFAVVPYMFYFKKTRNISMVTLFTSFLHAGLSYTLIKIYGMEGATYASVITFGISFFMIWYFSNKIYPMPWFSFWRQ